MHRINPGPQKRAAERQLENCQKKEAACYFARDLLALRDGIKAAAPLVDERIRACKNDVVDKRALLQEATAAASERVAQLDARRAQRERLGSREAEINAAQARLASASDTGDDAGAEVAAREIARIRRELLDTTEPLELRLQAAHDAAARAEAHKANAEEQLAAAAKALRAAELDELALARDEAAANLLNRDIELAVAGYFDQASTEYRIGMSPQVLQHLRGRRQEVTGHVIQARAKERRMALEADRRDVP